MFGKKKFELAARHRVQNGSPDSEGMPHAARRNALLFTPSGFDNYYAQIDHKFTTRSGFAIFFSEKVSSILSKGEKTHMFKAFTYLKRAHSVVLMGVGRVDPAGRPVGSPNRPTKLILMGSIWKPSNWYGSLDRIISHRRVNRFDPPCRRHHRRGHSAPSRHW